MIGVELPMVAFCGDFDARCSGRFGPLLVDLEKGFVHDSVD